jgi:hypothetical protein
MSYDDESDLPEADHVTSPDSSLPLAWGTAATVIRAQNGLILVLARSVGVPIC